MPLYEYACRGCDRRFEELVRRGETPSCPACDSRELDRLLSAREWEAPPTFGKDPIDDLSGLCPPRVVRGNMAAGHDDHLVVALAGRRIS